jgi:hypothetical protein
MADEMFFRPQNLALLADVRYGFGDQRLDGMNEDFLRDLEASDRAFTGVRPIAFREIASSIHY